MALLANNQTFRSKSCTDVLAKDRCGINSLGFSVGVAKRDTETVFDTNLDGMVGVSWSRTILTWSLSAPSFLSTVFLSRVNGTGYLSLVSEQCMTVKGEQAQAALSDIGKVTLSGQ